MGLVREIKDKIAGHHPGPALTSASERGHVGGGTPTDKIAACGLRVTDPALEPVENRQFELAGTGSLFPGSAVEVESAGDEVPQRARPGSLSRNDGHVPGMIAP